MGLILDSSVIIAAERRRDTAERLIERIINATGDQEAALSAVGVDLAMVDLPDPMDGSVYDYLAELVDAVAPLGRRLPARLRQITTCS